VEKGNWGKIRSGKSKTKRSNRKETSLGVRRNNLGGGVAADVKTGPWFRENLGF